MKSPSKKAIKMLKDHSLSAEAQRDAVISARAAGYRRGKDESDRALNTLHNNEMNRLRIEMAGKVNETVAIMDREFVKGWLAMVAYHNKANADQEIATISVRLCNAIARELTRGYDKEKQA